MNYTIDQLLGVGPEFAEVLATAGVGDTDALLVACASKAGRACMAQRTGLSEEQLLVWTNRADLMRIPGVGREFVELLEASGVGTVRELRTRRADCLAARVREVNAERRLVTSTPSRFDVESWIVSAITLEMTLSY